MIAAFAILILGLIYAVIANYGKALMCFAIYWLLKRQFEREIRYMRRRERYEKTHYESEDEI